jgi:hypothetical protein
VAERLINELDKEHENHPEMMALKPKFQAIAAP